MVFGAPDLVAVSVVLHSFCFYEPRCTMYGIFHAVIRAETQLLRLNFAPRMLLLRIFASY